MLSHLDPKKTYFIPLGGSEEFGVNLNAYIHQKEILLIDCGIGFADERYPGIDILLPDTSFLEQHKDNIAGMIITHAHEDHIGAVAYLWDKFECPLYATNFTASVLKHKLDEASLKNVPVHVIEPKNEIKIGSFNLGFVQVAHSIPDAVSVYLKTKEGIIVHSGDWNLDPKPVIGPKTDEKKFKALGKKDVLAYIGDSTNAQVGGYAGSESDVEKSLEDVFKTCKGRIVITIFSSNISRIRTVSRLAEKLGRDVGIVGRSLHRMAGIARKCGYLDGCPEFIPQEDIGCLPEDKTVIIATGSQGEPRAALSKIASGTHSDIVLSRGDTVIFSSRAIPGNEKDINQVKNKLTEVGINVITPRDTDKTIHVSGHPCQEEIAEMLSWLKPQMLIPVHGERQQLEAQSEFAARCQIAQTLVPHNGAVIEITKKGPKITDRVHAGILAVDKKRLIQADHPAISQRRKLQYTGAIHVSLCVDNRGKLCGDVKVTTLGLIDEQDPAEMQIMDALYDEVYEIFEDTDKQDRMDDHIISEEIRIGVRRFVVNTLGIKPHVTVHAIEI